MADDGWQGMSHQEIISKLSGLGVESARAEADRWTAVYGAVSDSVDTAMKVRSKLLDTDSWSGEAANSAYDAVDRTYKKIAAPDTGLAAEAGKLSQAAEQDGETLIAAGRVPSNYPVPDKNASKDEKQQALNAIRAAAQSAYTNPMSTDRPKVTDPDVQQLGPTPNDPGGAGGNGGGGSGSGGSGSGTQTPSSSDGLANKNTKPQLAGGDGQQAGAGQGQGSGGGQGGGSGGGQGSGSGGGQGSGGAGSGLGSGSGGSGLPIGSTTAAGFSPSSTGTGGGGSGTALSGPGGLSGLRGGGLPGGAASGTGAGGVNPAGVGAAGVRGGPMGMMGGAGGHGKGGKGEEDDDHAIPSYLINVDNGNELFGQSIKASPGVIGDWTENEEAEKKAREAEIRRYKSMGWDVKFE